MLSLVASLRGINSSALKDLVDRWLGILGMYYMPEWHFVRKVTSRNLMKYSSQVSKITKINVVGITAAETSVNCAQQCPLSVTRWLYFWTNQLVELIRLPDVGCTRLWSKVENQAKQWCWLRIGKELAFCLITVIIQHQSFGYLKFYVSAWKNAKICATV